MEHVIDLDAVGQVFTSSDGTRITALQGVDLHLRRNEFVSLIGPSGCGKSTILRLISGLLRPTEGLVRIFDYPVTEPRDEIGMVFQKPTLLPWLSVLDNITFPMRHKYGRVSDAEHQRARELLAMVGLGDFGHKRPHELSGGMQQRVSIARSLLHDPDILLMDEPFSALDALTRDEMSFELLRIWNERPKTVVFVTHSIQEALLLSDRIVVMSARPGKVDDIIDVPLPRPRNMATLADPVFTQMANDIRMQVFSRAPV
ncbi:ABC transporter ATP-binding protein [Corticibacter populi]|uniref:ABC transporter ATP-binding protein n=1 Tax=Corticibacter populi TaxID=1550736 RepID=A0A3M6R0B7_9BURK|nr:ABC transporter ATP-binding protein [Corticibacter populi]RMX08688.1 ABC transporter ATP-binding protein [Corticibacter populi]RZS36031.1 NitT/TauT family transport system ATP-binding protein [Corticibacter populi]